MTLFPPVLIFLDHPIGVAGLSMKHRGVPQSRRPGERACEEIISISGEL
jgi:hypothetical protein